MKSLNLFKQKNYFDIILLSMVAFYPELYKFIWFVFARTGLTVISKNLTTIIWAGIVIIFFEQFSKRLKASDIVVYIGIVVVMGIFCLFPWYYAFTPNRYFDFITGVLPYFLLGRIFRYDEEHKNIYRFFATITLCLAIFYTYVFVIGQDEFMDDNMYAAYLITIPILLLVDSFFDKGVIFYKIFGVVGILYLFLLGTRGPLVCIVVFCGLMLLKKIGSIKAGILIGIAILILNTFITSAYYTSFLVSFSNTAEKIGFSTRILEFLEEDNLMDDTNRTSKQKRVIEEIKKAPFEVRGPYADWIITGRRYDVNKYEVENYGVYVHNFFLEMWSHYGVILGSFVILFVIISIVRLYVKCRKESSVVPIAFICSGFVVLMFSDSYLSRDAFFMLMGLCYNRKFLEVENKEMPVIQR